MRTLFKMDTKDYDPDGRALVRPSVRGIILQNRKVAMVHSLKYDYYKFPGGGMEPWESRVDTLIREVAEEAGLRVRPDSIQEYGLVTRTDRSVQSVSYDFFIQDNFYYLCQAADGVMPQKLDDYEQYEHFTLEWVTPEHAIDINRNRDHGSKNPLMLERETQVLEILIREGYFSAF